MFSYFSTPVETVYGVYDTVSTFIIGYATMQKFPDKCSRLENESFIAQDVHKQRIAA